MSIDIGPYDLFDLEAQTLTIPVNVVGVMGAGLAKIVSMRSKSVFDEYRRVYNARGYPDAVDPKSILIHRLHVVPYPVERSKQQVLLFPTKKHWLRPSTLEWIDENLAILARDYKKLKVKSLAIPAIGCGYGELEWRDVLPLIEQHLGKLPIPVFVCEPTLR